MIRLGEFEGHHEMVLAENFVLTVNMCKGGNVRNSPRRWRPWKLRMFDLRLKTMLRSAP